MWTSRGTAARQDALPRQALHFAASKTRPLRHDISTGTLVNYQHPPRLEPVTWVTSHSFTRRQDGVPRDDPTMGVPKPTYPLSGHCSIVHDGTLYVYSPAGFQSLDLTEGAKWKTLPMDISLTGAQCVKAGKGETAMLYVVGGSANATAADWSYPGLMGYSIAQKKWDWIRPETWVTQNRQNHGAIYLEDAQSILVYAGSQTTGDITPSTQTFQISTVSPYRVSSQPDVQAPPSFRPMLLPWDSNRAVMVGGGPTNKAVWTFGAVEGWLDLGVGLLEPITNQDAVQGTVVSGTDGSKILETFDMSVNPNKVTRTALLKQGGTVASPGMTVGDKKAKRVTIQNWPQYNGTLAPTVARTGYSLASGDDDLVVVTGGSDVDPLCIFDQQDNAWVNATELFQGKQQQSVLLPTTSTSSTIPSPTASSSPSATAAGIAPAASSNKDKMLTVLGATLGAIFGIAILLILILFCLKQRKSKKTQPQETGYIEKDRLSFADRGTEYMTEAGGSVGQKFAEVNASQTSLAIVSGRTPGHKKGMASDSSTSGLVKKTSPLGYSEPVELSKFDLKPEPMAATMVRQNSGRAPPQPRVAAANLSRSRSSGWSRYFANNEATNLAQMPADRSTYASERTSTGSHSMYTDSRMYSQPPQAVAPLDIPRFDGQRINKVAKGSPTLGNSQENLAGPAMLPMQAELARANSNGSTHSGISHDDRFMRSPVDSWSPVSDNDRPVSSNYTGSVVIDNPSTYYPDNTSSFYPKSNISSFYPGQTSLGIPDGRDSTVTMFPNPNANQNTPPQLPNTFSSFYPAPPRVPGAPEGRESTVTMFPSGAGANTTPKLPNTHIDSYYASAPLGVHQDRESTITMFPRPGGEGPSKKEQSDMSWLNLGAGK